MTQTSYFKEHHKIMNLSMFLLVLFFLNMDIVLSQSWDPLRHAKARAAPFSLSPYHQAYIYGTSCLFFLLPSLYCTIKKCLQNILQEKLTARKGFDHYKGQLLHYFLNALTVGSLVFLTVFFYDTALFTHSIHEWTQLLVKLFRFFSFLLISYMVCILISTFILQRSWALMQKKALRSTTSELPSQTKTAHEEKTSQSLDAFSCKNNSQDRQKTSRPVFLEMLAIFATILIAAHLILQFVQKYY